MSKYRILLNILDRLREEATTTHTAIYNPPKEETEKINHARGRSFIHLFLKVSFGLLTFKEREYYITDNTNDGGIDGYYINKETKTIYFIQSKFRNTEKNFESKKIELEEILVMDINRILEGEELDEKGNAYNGKIKQLIRDIQNIDDIARYKYQVILLANLEGLTASKIRYLTGGYPAEIFDYEKCYTKLLFPVISGTYFNASDLNIFIDLSNKNAGSKISYTVQTKNSECEITVLFVPTIELGKILHKYKNSILKYNPRSYLDFEGQKVNKAIRETILETETNEFALYNNGITMLSDETYINEKIGQKNKAQLTVKNPQIINGGQTSYTLSRIYEENLENNVNKIFENKEVLLKIITLIDTTGTVNDSTKVQLIDDISDATNQQTPVITADRFSNEHIHIKIQNILFERYGILYERKRGEFGDGIYNNYVNIDQVLERNLFFRLYYASNGEINKSVQKKLFMRQSFSDETLTQTDKLDNFYFGYLFFKKFFKIKGSFQKIEKNIYGQICAMTKLYKPKDISDYNSAINQNISKFTEIWREFVQKASKIKTSHNKTYIDGDTQTPVSYFSESKWYKSELFEKDVYSYFFDNGKMDDNTDIQTRGSKNLLFVSKPSLSESGLTLKDRIELNIQNNKNRAKIAHTKLRRFTDQLDSLKERMETTTSAEIKYSITGWISELQIKIDQTNDMLQKYSKWIIEDVDKLDALRN